MFASTLFAGLALGALLFAWLCWPARHPVSAAGWRWARRGLALLGLCGAMLAGLLAVALQGYRPLETGTLVADIAVQSSGDGGAFTVRVSLPGAIPRAYLIEGDQWQFDVRLLRWRLPWAVLGAPRVYLPDRVSGRYADVEREREAPRSAHALSDDRAWDAWRLQRRFAGWLPMLASDFGSSAYLPLIDGGRFRVRVGDIGGIVVEPADAQTARRLADQDW